MKIAVIDDERPARKELVHQIMDAMPGSQIEEADSGASAIELISRRTFDLLFVDISLGDMDGTTLAAAARRILPDAQIVFATAYSQYGVKAFELGVNNYILKPFDPDRVRRVLEKCQKDLQKNQALTASAVCSCDDHQPWGESCRPASSSLYASQQEAGDPVTAAFPASRMPINMNRTIILVDIQQIVYIETSGEKLHHPYPHPGLHGKPSFRGVRETPGSPWFLPHTQKLSGESQLHHRTLSLGQQQSGCKNAGI